MYIWPSPNQKDTTLRNNMEVGRGGVVIYSAFPESGDVLACFKNMFCLLDDNQRVSYEVQMTEAQIYNVTQNH